MTRKNLTGKKYGKLTAIKYSRFEGTCKTYWLFKCECGNKVEKVVRDVRRGRVKSCGCLRKKPLRKKPLPTKVCSRCRKRKHINCFYNPKEKRREEFCSKCKILPTPAKEKYLGLKTNCNTCGQIVTDHPRCFNCDILVHDNPCECKEWGRCGYNHVKRAGDFCQSCYLESEKKIGYNRSIPHPA